MTRKHFIALAEQLHAIQPHTAGFHKLEDWDAAMTEWTKAVSAISAVCADANELFNGHRFEAACRNGV